MASDPWAFQRWAFHTSTGNPVRKSVLVALAVMAEANTGRCEALQETLAQQVEAGLRAVRGHLKGLEEDGLIARRHQYRHDGKRRGDEFLLLAPWVETWPDGLPARSAASAPTTGTNKQPLPAQIAPARTTTPLNYHSLFVDERRGALVHLEDVVENQPCGREEKRAENGASDLPSVTLWGKRVAPSLVADAVRALEHFSQASGVETRPTKATGRPTEALTMVCRAMRDHPAARTVWRRMIDCALADPWWEGDAHVGVVFSPKVVERSIQRAKSERPPAVNGRGLTPSGRAIAKLLAAPSE